MSRWPSIEPRVFSHHRLKRDMTFVVVAYVLNSTFAFFQFFSLAVVVMVSCSISGIVWDPAPWRLGSHDALCLLGGGLPGRPAAGALHGLGHAGHCPHCHHMEGQPKVAPWTRPQERVVQQLLTQSSDNLNTKIRMLHIMLQRGARTLSYYFSALPVLVSLHCSWHSEAQRN